MAMPLARKSSMDQLIEQMAQQEVVNQQEESAGKEDLQLVMREEAKKTGNAIIGVACFASQATAILGATSASAAPIGIGVAAGLKAVEGPSKETFGESVDSGMLDNSIETSQKKYEESIDWSDRNCVIL